jgi:broad specificity phosphatase PhoE/ADP-ribose pyrophosphatase YjhB (NUDIX family)
VAAECETELTTILAAGTVLWRPADPTGAAEIALVHRPKYDDWSLPKGKCEVGEHPVLTAVRETQEETGFTGPLTRSLGHIRYQVSGPEGGTPKVVHYWAMPAVGGVFTPSTEVDRIEWVPALAAMDRLTRPADRAPLQSFLDAAPTTTTVLLIRHARAGDRKAWRGPDEGRPLDAAGEVQAQDIAAVAASFGVGAVLSADVLRCQQTVTPLAATLGLAVEPTRELSERAHARHPQRALRLLDELVARGAPVALCSQGGVIPDLLEALGERGPVRPGPVRSRKGSIWVLSFDGRALVGAQYVESDSLPI